jgi:hypothetical protein
MSIKRQQFFSALEPEFVSASNHRNRMKTSTGGGGGTSSIVDMLAGGSSGRVTAGAGAGASGSGTKAVSSNVKK